MSVPEVCSHEIVCVEDSVAPAAAGEEGECIEYTFEFNYTTGVKETRHHNTLCP